MTNKLLSVEEAKETLIYWTDRTQYHPPEALIPQPTFLADALISAVRREERERAVDIICEAAINNYDVSIADMLTKKILEEK